jgi:putative restriction endonuclease
VLPGGTYSEAAHIRALGKPHLGPDTVDNILCLCPNHHVLFDRGSIWIDADHVVQPLGTPLRNLDANKINPQHLEYHRSRREHHS